MRTVVIIGAGWFGLQTAAQVQDVAKANAMDVQVIVLERHSAVGGMWSSIKYPDLYTHGSFEHLLSRAYRPPPFHIEEDVASQAQVVAFWQQYAKHHGIDVRLNTNVHRVHVVQHDSFHVHIGHDRVVQANAVFISAVASIPKRVPIRGHGPNVVHIYDINASDLAKHNRVVVMGGGKGALDVVAALRKQRRSPVAWVIRTPRIFQTVLTRDTPTYRYLLVQMIILANIVSQSPLHATTRYLQRHGMVYTYATPADLKPYGGIGMHLTRLANCTPNSIAAADAAAHRITYGTISELKYPDVVRVRDNHGSMSTVHADLVVQCTGGIHTNVTVTKARDIRRNSNIRLYENGRTIVFRGDVILHALGLTRRSLCPIRKLNLHTNIHNTTIDHNYANPFCIPVVHSYVVHQGMRHAIIAIAILIACIVVRPTSVARGMAAIPVSAVIAVALTLAYMWHQGLTFRLPQ